MTYVETLDPTTWDRICTLAEHGPQPGQSYAELEELLTKAEEVTNRARALVQPRAVSPSKARIFR
jgi:hypothetical protein